MYLFYIISLKVALNIITLTLYYFSPLGITANLCGLPLLVWSGEDQGFNPGWFKWNAKILGGFFCCIYDMHAVVIRQSKNSKDYDSECVMVGYYYFNQTYTVVLIHTVICSLTT